MAIKTLLNLLFPGKCLLCGNIGHYLCPDCASLFVPDNTQYCPSCGIKNSNGRFCGRTCSCGFFFDQLIVSMNYGENDFLRKTISIFKYRNQKDLCKYLALPMKQQFSRQQITLPPNLVFSPVPIHKSKLKTRGFNQSLLLAKKIGPPILEDCLERGIMSVDQATLTKAQRIKNLKGTISVKEEFAGFVRGRGFVVVDDVATTCSTLNECARALKKCGAEYVCGLVLARVV